MINKINKYLLILLAFACFNCFNIRIINADDAAEYSAFYNSTSDLPSTGNNDGGNEQGGGTAIKCEDLTVAGAFPSCGVIPKYSVTSNLYFKIYDKEKKEKISIFSSDFQNMSFKAGTFIGIDIYEEYKKTGAVTINPSCTQVIVTCEKPGKPYDECNGTYIPKDVTFLGKTIIKAGCYGTWVTKYGDGEQYTIKEGSCPEGHKRITAACGSCTPPTPRECREEAEKMLNSIVLTNTSSSFVAKMQNNNNIDDDSLIEIKSYKESTDTGIQPKDNLDSTVLTRTITMKYKYNPQQPCINVKTGNIRYVDFAGTDKCNANELTVKNLTVTDENDNISKIGMYFIPLNAKSNSEFIYELTGNQLHEGKLCESIINNSKKDDRWKQIIVKNDNDKTHFSNDTTIETATKEVLKNGCYYATTISFNILQEFYNENDSKAIEGYGFYFRPIDYTKPFPNGISENSVWNGLLDTNTNKLNITDSSENSKEIDLNDSFKSITYTAFDSNSNNNRTIANIRNYNKDNFYTSWENMNKDGSSGFIAEGYVKRNGTPKYYKLGCGPANADWEECK